MAIKNNLTYDLDVNSLLNEYEDMFSNPNYYKTSTELLEEYIKIFDNPKIADEYYKLNEIDKLKILNEAITNKIKIEDTNIYKGFNKG